MGILDFIFGKHSAPPPEPEVSPGTDTVESLREYLGISPAEMEALMKKCGIPPSEKYLTQEQSIKINTEYYSQGIDDKGDKKGTKTKGEKVKREAVKIPLSDIIRDYSYSYEASREKYAGAKLIFTGKVETVRKDGENNFAVEIIPDDENYSGKVVFRFVSNMKSRLQQLRKGQEISAAGFMNGVDLQYNNDVITLANSVILDTSSARPETRQPHKVRVSKMTNIPETRIPRSSVPEEGSKVFTEDGKEYLLGEMIGSGGEGSVYRVNASGLAAKIYNDENCTERRREKIRQMAASRLNYEGICFPREALYTQGKEFTGYIMPEAKGDDLVYLLREKEVFAKRFPNWKKENIIKLAITILKKIQYLHNHDVLIGDINLLNILFVSPDEVYFLDTDSYQFKGFPSPVGSVHFTAPELQEKDLRTVMRTQGNENFAVAVLLFMLMMQGLSPYAHQGGSNPAENIKKGLFPFGVGGKKVPNVWETQPKGSARFQWSHLMRTLKSAFWDTFHAEGDHRDEARRYTASEWLTMTLKYYKSLPGMLQEDPLSNEIFPDRLKRSKNKNYRTCIHCGEEKPEEMFADDTTCWKCRNSMRKEVFETRKCSVCGETFTITQGEYEYYTSKGLPLPKRCLKCREARKNSNNSWNI